MIYSKEIIKQVNSKRIIIEPFMESNVNPNSYDITIGNTISFYDNGAVLCEGDQKKAKQIIIPEEGYELQKNKFYFADSLEILTSNYYVPMLHNRSGVARKGLFTHITADLMQLKHNEHIHLQLYSKYNIRIFPFQKIAQISFWKVDR